MFKPVGDGFVVDSAVSKRLTGSLEIAKVNGPFGIVASECRAARLKSLIERSDHFAPRGKVFIPRYLVDA